MSVRLGALAATCWLASPFHLSASGGASPAAPAADRYVLQIENRRDVPLVTWIVKAGTLEVTNDFSVLAPVDSPGRGSIQPGDTRAIMLAPQAAPLEAPAVVILAVFEDGGIDGQRAAVDGWTAVRRRRADDATFWLTALEAGRDKTESETVARVRPIISERRRQFAARAAGPTHSFFDDAAGEGAMVERVSMLIDETLPRPPGAITAVLSTFRDDLRRRRLSMLRPLSPLSVAGSENPTAAPSLVVRVTKDPGHP